MRFRPRLVPPSRPRLHTSSHHYAPLSSAPKIHYKYLRPLEHGAHDVVEVNYPHSGSQWAASNPFEFEEKDPEKCSGHGFIKRGKCSCFCDWEGETCDQHKDWSTTECLFPCANCTGGVCFDPPKAIRGTKRPFIYTYDLPLGLNQLRPRVAMSRNTPWEFWRRLAGSGHATSFAEEADFFFVPVAPMGVVSHGVIPLAMRWASENFPYFNRSGGRDHLIVTPWDFGGSWVAKYPGLEKVRFLSHWGLNDQQATYVNVCPFCGPSYIPGKDFVIPDFLETRYALLPRPPITAARPTLVFFSGQPTSKVRERLLAGAAKYAGREDVRIMKGGAHNLGAEMETSRFCASPPGAGFGSRATLALSRGCIPVLIGDSISAVYDGLLDETKFAVLLKEEQMENMVAVLEAVGKEREAELRRGVYEVADKFVWDENREGDAFETIVTDYLGTFQHHPTHGHNPVEA